MMTVEAITPGAEVIVDARGHRCPTPTLRLQSALARLQDGETVTLLADDPMARIDVAHFAAGQGHTLISIADVAGALRFTIRKGSPGA